MTEVNTQLNIDHWQYLHGKPEVKALFKQQADDFQVTEVLGYKPSGQGEHIYLWLEKTNLNTAFVAEQIAKFTGLPLRAVTYAGRKDKHAKAYQWFAVHCPGNKDFDWSAFTLSGAKVLKAIRHQKKLRVGQLKGNEFVIHLRQLSCLNGIEQRIKQIGQQGVPNYFGDQRFGDSRHHSKGGNLALGQQMLNGEVIRNRNKKNLAISVLRAWLFNEFIHQRIAQQHFFTPMEGDVFCLAGSNSFFCADSIDCEIEKRLAEQDIQISAPMWGKGELASQGQAKTFEQEIAEQQPVLTEGLAKLGLKQERRPIRLFPANLDWKMSGTDLTISFFLPSGCFATSVLRELVQLETV